MGLFGDAVSSLIGSCVTAPKTGTKLPPPLNDPTVKFDSLKMTHSFSRSVLHVVSRNAQCSSKKNQVLLLARIDAKKRNNLYRFRSKITGAISLRNFTKSRKTFQEKLSTEAGP